jgi:hypothetical protein
MVARKWLLATVAAGMFCWGGCVNIDPNVKVDMRSRPEPVDSSRVPQTASHEEARRELNKAYQNIQWLERELARQERKKDEYKRERDRYKKQRDRYKDRLDDD